MKLSLNYIQTTLYALQNLLFACIRLVANTSHGTLAIVKPFL